MVEKESNGEQREKQIIPEHASTGLSGTIQRGIEGNVPMRHHWNICYLSSLQSRRMVAGLFSTAEIADLLSAVPVLPQQLKCPFDVH